MATIYIKNTAYIYKNINFILDAKIQVIHNFIWVHMHNLQWCTVKCDVTVHCVRQISL